MIPAEMSVINDQSPRPAEIKHMALPSIAMNTVYIFVAVRIIVSFLNSICELLSA